MATEARRRRNRRGGEADSGEHKGEHKGLEETWGNNTAHNSERKMQQAVRGDSGVSDATATTALVVNGFAPTSGSEKEIETLLHSAEEAAKASILIREAHINRFPSMSSNR